MGLPGKIVKALPEGIQQFLRKQYYPGVLQKYTADHWEYTSAIKPLIPAGGTVIDAGANVGYLSHLFSQWVGNAEGQIHSFEPVPWTYEILASNIRKLKIGNVSTYQLALSDAPGTARMQIPRYEDGRENLYESRITTENAQHLRTVDVTMTSLDVLLHDVLPSVDFIKIDVEGHELQVVQGALKILKRDHPPLLIEVSGKMADDATPAGQLRKALSQLEYSVFTIADGVVEPWDGVQECVDYLFLAEVA
jgi:FkbM family methyltransferase